MQSPPKPLFNSGSLPTMVPANFAKPEEQAASSAPSPLPEEDDSEDEFSDNPMPQTERKP